MAKLKEQPSGILLPFIFDNIPVRGKLLQLNDVSAHVPSLAVGSHCGHSYVAKMLAEMLAASIAFAFDLKDAANVTLQIHSESDIPLLVTQCENGGNLKAFANIEGDVSDTSFQDMSRANGTMVLTVEQHGQQYQSVVYLNEKSISSSIENYFEQSAQSKTYFHVFTEDKNDKISCGAIMLQVMGESSAAQQVSEEDMKDNWRRLKLILNTIQPEEIVPGKYMPDSVLMRLFAEDVVRVFETAPLTFSVTDIREKMRKALKSIGVKNCQDLLKEGPIVMTCEFSGKEETFTEKELADLFGDEWLA